MRGAYSIALCPALWYIYNKYGKWEEERTMGLWEDAKNIRDKDPAARNVAEVIILYSGFHVLY